VYKGHSTLIPSLKRVTPPQPPRSFDNDFGGEEDDVDFRRERRLQREKQRRNKYKDEEEEGEGVYESLYQFVCYVMYISLNLSLRLKRMNLMRTNRLESLRQSNS
jgi:hypothetical protein